MNMNKTPNLLRMSGYYIFMECMDIAAGSILPFCEAGCNSAWDTLCG